VSVRSGGRAMVTIDQSDENDTHDNRLRSKE
jgi:hypothetical protein